MTDFSVTPELTKGVRGREVGHSLSQHPLRHIRQPITFSRGRNLSCCGFRKEVGALTIHPCLLTFGLISYL